MLLSTKKVVIIGYVNKLVLSNIMCVCEKIKIYINRYPWITNVVVLVLDILMYFYGNIALKIVHRPF